MTLLMKTFQPKKSGKKPYATFKTSHIEGRGGARILKNYEEEKRGYGINREINMLGFHGCKYKNVNVYLRVEWRRRPEAEFRRPG